MSEREWWENSPSVQFLPALFPSRILHKPQHHPQTSLHWTETAPDHWDYKSTQWISSWRQNRVALKMQIQQNDAPDYLIRSFLALSAWEAAKPASLSAIFFLFHSINSAGVICVAVCSFARWNIEQENVGLTTYVQDLSSYEQIGKTGRELNLVFDFVLNCQLLWWLLFQEGFHLRFKDISRRKCVSVMTLFATIGAWPEPPILFLFHSIQKILANLLYISKHKKITSQWTRQDK